MAKLNGVKTLDMVNGDIKKVEYNGAVYEFTGARVKPNDLLLVTDADAIGDVIQGGFYEADDDSEGGVCFLDEDNDLRCAELWSGDNTCLVFSKATVEVKYNVGDYVKIIGNDCGHEFATGEIVVVTRLESDGKSVYEAKSLDGEEWCIDNEEVVLATEEEVATAKAEIEANKAEDKWASIGREVNEYKKGDIVRVLEDNAFSSNHKSGDIGEIATEVTNHGAGDFRVDTPRIDFVNWVRPKDVELITPVEARFDKAGGVDR